MFTGGDNTVKIWDIEKNCEVDTINCKTSVSTVAFSGNSEMLACAGSEGVIKIFDLVSLQKIKELRGHADDVNTMYFTEDNKYIVSSSSDDTVRLWDILAGEEVRKLSSRDRGIRKFVLSSDNDLIAIGKSDGTIDLFDAAPTRSIGLIQLPSGSAVSLGIQGPPRRIFVRMSDGKTLHWNIESLDNPIQVPVDDDQHFDTVRNALLWEVVPSIHAVKNGDTITLIDLSESLPAWQLELASRLAEGHPELHGRMAMLAADDEDWYAACFHKSKQVFLLGLYRDVINPALFGSPAWLIDVGEIDYRAFAVLADRDDQDARKKLAEILEEADKDGFPRNEMKPWVSEALEQL